VIFEPPDLSKRVSDALDEAVDISDWIEEHHPGKIVLTRAARIAGPCFSIVLTHRAAIMLLLRYDCATSAFALLRSVYESLCRGLWAEKFLNTPERAKHFKAVKGDLKIESMVKALDKGTSEKVYTTQKQALYTGLSDYAHGGLKQIMRWISEEEIAPQHTDEEVLEVLWMTNFFALDALAGIARLSELDTTAIDAKRAEYVAKLAKAHTAKGAGGAADSEPNV
jgi:hypothetical protein